jgi:AcrR family transcriptional regulator
VESKELTRRRVLDAARARLEEVGFEATNIRDVAARAEVSPATVIVHFGDKKQLLHAAFFEDLAATWERAKTRERTGSLARDLCAIANTFFEYYAAKPSVSRELLRESLFAEPPWQARFVGQLAEVQARVVELAEAARAEGEIARPLDASVLGASFFSFYYFALLAWAQGGHPSPTALFDKMLEQHLQPYLAKKE